MFKFSRSSLMFVIGFTAALIFFAFCSVFYLKFGEITLYLDKDNLINEIEVILHREIKIGVGNYLRDLRETVPEQVAQDIVEHLQQQKMKVLWEEIAIPDAVLENLKPFLNNLSEKIVSERFSEETINIFTEQIADYLGKEMKQKIDSIEFEETLKIEVLPKIKTRVQIKWN